MGKLSVFSINSIIPCGIYHIDLEGRYVLLVKNNLLCTIHKITSDNAVVFKAATDEVLNFDFIINDIRYTVKDNILGVDK